MASTSKCASRFFRRLHADSALFAKLNAARQCECACSRTAETTTTDRAKVIARYAKVGEMKGDAAHGRTLIQQQCAICHRFKGEGQELGPDLGMVAAKPLDWLLAAIFDPNAASSRAIRRRLCG
jgi:mono/diheme cytochrome c family protein